VYDHRAVARALPFRLALLVSAAVGLLAAAPATASPGSSILFTHSAKGGSLSGGRLTLSGVAGRVTWLTNAGDSGVVRVPRLHRRLFLPGKPATGTLHVAGHRGGDEPTFRLSRPRYNRKRHTVSYRAKRLNNKRLVPSRSARAPRAAGAQRFGAASLSIVGHPQVTGGDNGGHDCPVGIVNETGYGAQSTGSSKWDTDSWDPSPTSAIVNSYSKVPTGADTETFWESDGGLFRGCSNTTTWQLVVDPNDPNRTVPPQGVVFTVSLTYSWNGSPAPSCSSSNPQFTCTPSSGANYWLLRGPVPCCIRPSAAASVASMTRR
jgi:hypothetical protein